MVRRFRPPVNPEGVTDLSEDDVYPVPEDERFIDERFNERGFIDAPDLEMLAMTLISEFDLDSASNQRIEYWWKRESTADAGGKCIRASGPLHKATGANFVIWLAADGPRAAEYTLRQVKALLYHELLHVAVTEKGKPAIRKHDAEIFRDELQDFGLWNGRLRGVFGQLEMPLFKGAH